MSEHRLVVCIILPVTKHDVIEYLINATFNNSLKYYVLVRHSNLTTTSIIGTLWYRFVRNNTRAYFFGATLYFLTDWCRMEEANRMLVESREKIERQNQQLSDYEAEINLLRRRLETLETDREKDKKQIATLQDALNRARIVSTLS